jgi:GNAT superfamily N-acetyltransferase
VVAPTRDWVRGWVVCRAASVLPVGEAGWQVDGLGPTRTREVVLAEPGAALVDACVRRLDADTWLTLVTAEPWPGPVPHGLRLGETHESLMARDLPDAPSADLPAAGPGVLWVVDGDRATVTVQVDGEAAAQGAVGVVGETAVVDRVRTAEAFRRRGLATTVMQHLLERAAQQSARRALLVASPEGRALYSRLGWRRVASVVTLLPARPG